MMHVNEAARVAPGVELPERPPTPMGLAIRKYGNHVPLPIIHACNTLTPDQFASLKLKLRRDEIRRNAEHERKAREDRRAFQKDMEEWEREMRRWKW